MFLLISLLSQESFISGKVLDKTSTISILLAISPLIMDLEYISCDIKVETMVALPLHRCKII